MPIYEFGSKTTGVYRAFGLLEPIAPDLPGIDDGPGQRLGQHDAIVMQIAAQGAAFLCPGGKLWHGSGLERALADQLDRNAHVGQVPPVPISSHRWHPEAKCESQAGPVAEGQPLSLRPRAKIGRLGSIVLCERLDSQSAF